MNFSINDITIFSSDVDRAVEFYQQKMGFSLLRREEGFAEFTNQKIHLSIWDRENIYQNTGVAGQALYTDQYQSAIGIKLNSANEVDEMVDLLKSKHVNILTKPADYPWKARCSYFTDPDGQLWEIYAWNEDK